ncbi:class II aminoacyl-tRNA synthetase/biotinyl protein ligase and lipoyl protein ligase like protein [Babesia gibsoni]|uniref:phenylalanine--tRNA ligase n=1 Tax=Babesia gibsoni TaxID=33632 RepID=A0AAD8PEE3_BABGI|nr:class II aminoacyl-tRNA synthetase/biotinyl protein ligase and lipoyl protein ligase like protein [Babesia gibsoni]
MVIVSLSFIRPLLAAGPQLSQKSQRRFLSQAYTGIPQHIHEKISRRLDTDQNHPIGLACKFIREFFLDSQKNFNSLNNEFTYIPFSSDPISIRDNFDELQVPLNHVSREPCDNFYLSEDYVKGFKLQKEHKHCCILKDVKDGIYTQDVINRIDDAFNHSSHRLLPTHVTSHLPELLRRGIKKAIYSGQVFRRDAIDSKHFPVFHQLDGVMLFTKDDLEAIRLKSHMSNTMDDESVIISHLKETLEDLVLHLLRKVRKVEKGGSDVPMHTLQNGLHLSANNTCSKGFTQKDDGYMGDMQLNKKDIFKWDSNTTFPFTHPSLELYLKQDGEWIEVLGCGKLKDVIVANNFPSDKLIGSGGDFEGGWAFGIGLERLIMCLCKIGDIRQFWETDERFLKQYQGSYKHDIIPIFKPYSRNPPVCRDISFYINEASEEKKYFDENEFIGIFDELYRDYVEDVKLISSYVNPNTGKRSLCYRVTYRAMGENLTNALVNQLHEKALDRISGCFNIEIR